MAVDDLKCEEKGCSFSTKMNSERPDPAIAVYKKHLLEVHGRKEWTPPPPGTASAPPVQSPSGAQPLAGTPPESAQPQPPLAEIARVFALALGNALSPLYERIAAISQKVEETHQIALQSVTAAQQAQPAAHSSNGNGAGAGATPVEYQQPQQEQPMHPLLKLATTWLESMVKGQGALGSGADPMHQVLAMVKQTVGFTNELKSAFNQASLSDAEVRLAHQKELADTLKIHYAAGADPKQAIEAVSRTIDEQLAAARAPKASPTPTETPQ